MNKPPHTIPLDLLPAFTMNGKIPVLYQYCDDSRKEQVQWSLDQWNKTYDFIAQGGTGQYGKIDDWLVKALNTHLDRSTDAILFGATDQGHGPWYECLLFDFLNDVFVYDYNTPRYLRETVYPYESDTVMDCCVSISSIEHSGLGRYGDELDPDGDLKAMKWIKEHIAIGGKLFLSVPIGLDKLVFNAHRIYGDTRLPLLLEGWKLIDSFGYDSALLSRDTGLGWNPRDSKGELIHPEYPEYCPILVLENI